MTHTCRKRQRRGLDSSFHCFVHRLDTDTSGRVGIPTLLVDRGLRRIWHRGSFRVNYLELEFITWENVNTHMYICVI